MKSPVWSGDWPIPKTIRLPGLRLRIKVLSPEEAEERGCTYGIWSYGTPNSEHPYATIFLNGALPLAVQRYTIWHELIHAVNDGLDQMIEKFPEHVQTHSMATLAALRLEEVKEAAKEEKEENGLG
jgi:hypothetical protein